MTHQAHNIPWNVLASNFEWRLSNLCKGTATDFYWRYKPTQGKELTYFVNAFAKTIHEHADCERKKYPEHYDPPAEDEIVVSDESCRKIITTVRRFRLDLEERDYPFDEKSHVVICPHHHAETSHEACSYAANDCYEFYKDNKESFFNLEVFKTLLMHGEINALLRIYAHPRHDLASWWDAMTCQCEGPNLGWEHICKVALKAYLLLNLIHCFPETWQEGHGQDGDYRNTKAYQTMVHDLTQTSSHSDIAKYPHRQFFGVMDGQFDMFWSYNTANKATLKSLYGGSYPLGRMPYAAFVTFQKDVGYLPLRQDIPEARWVLREKGLPLELAETILHMAQYGKSTRRLPVEHDPFHPDNRAELDKYLKYCWILLIRCEVMARAIGMNLKWEDIVSEALIDIFGCGYDKSKGKHRVYTYNWDDGSRIKFL